MKKIIIIMLLISVSAFAGKTNYILTINNADDSLYWQETFDSSDKREKWLDKEKTRKYWKEEFKIIKTENITIEAPYTKPQIDIDLDAKLIDGTAKTKDLIEVLKRMRGL